MKPSEQPIFHSLKEILNVPEPECKLPLYLLERVYVNLPNDYNGWERTIRTQRGELEVFLDTVPSLSSRWELSFDKAWKIALKNVRKEYPQITFPTEWNYDRAIDPMLNNDFWLASLEKD